MCAKDIRGITRDLKEKGGKEKIDLFTPEGKKEETLLKSYKRLVRRTFSLLNLESKMEHESFKYRPFKKFSFI